MKSVLGIIGVIIVIVGILYFSWIAKRTINYNLMYESMVKETIKEMVKPEALK